MTVRYVNGHWEVVYEDSGDFVCSADTWDEALNEIKSLQTMS